MSTGAGLRPCRLPGGDSRLVVAGALNERALPPLGLDKPAFPKLTQRAAGSHPRHPKAFDQFRFGRELGAGRVLTRFNLCEERIEHPHVRGARAVGITWTLRHRQSVDKLAIDRTLRQVDMKKRWTG